MISIIDIEWDGSGRKWVIEELYGIPKEISPDGKDLSSILGRVQT